MQQKNTCPPELDHTDWTKKTSKRSGVCVRRHTKSSSRRGKSSKSCHKARTRDQFYTRDDVAANLVELARQECPKHHPWGLDHFRIIEPSAGTGAFLAHLPSHTLAYDLEPKGPGIIPADFLKLRLFARTPTAIVGNPPFGRNGSLAVTFFNHAALFGDVIAMVFPLSFQKVSVQNRLDLNFHLVEEIILPKNAFIFDGKPKHVPTVFQIWVKKDVPREKIKLATSHDDLDFTTWDHANIAISRVGSKAGCLHWDFDKSSQTTFFIRASPKVIKILMSLDLRTPAMRTTGQRSLAKTELIALYVQRKRELARQSLCELDVIGTLNQAHRWAAAICLKNFSSPPLECVGCLRPVTNGPLPHLRQHTSKLIGLLWMILRGRIERPSSHIQSISAAFRRRRFAATIVYDCRARPIRLDPAQRPCRIDDSQSADCNHDAENLRRHLTVCCSRLAPH